MIKAFSVDAYLAKTFDLHQYNCWNFACDIWFDLTGTRLHTDIEDFRVNALHHTATIQSERLQKIPVAESPCLVLMQRKHVNPHVGVFYNNRVLHLGPRGAAYTPFHNATFGFTAVSYYK